MILPRDDFERTLDGGLRLRLIRPDDEPRLVALYDHLSQQTAYQRFFTAMKRLPPDWAHFLANVDYQTRLALVIERQDAGGPELIAVARYEPTSEPGVAEVAFVVQDGWQGKGLGRLLLRELLAAAHPALPRVDPRGQLPDAPAPEPLHQDRRAQHHVGCRGALLRASGIGPLRPSAGE